jgi:hypothetical protein
VILAVAALGVFVKGFYDFIAGDIHIGYNYRGVRVVSNGAFVAALLLGVSGVAAFGASFPVDEDENDKNSS